MTTSTISVHIDNLPQCEVFEARKEHKATVFFLHVGFNSKTQLYQFNLSNPFVGSRRHSEESRIFNILRLETHFAG